MTNGIKPFTAEEGNLMAVKDTSDFGGPNMWRLYIRTVNGRWEYVSWKDVNSIQCFFKTILPKYSTKEEVVQKYQINN